MSSNLTDVNPPVRGPLFLWALTAALAGFLFGFDTVVISGAEKPIQALWGTTNLQHGLAMGAALWGTVLGSLLAGYPTDVFGRRNTLIAIGALYLVSAVWSALAGGVVPFAIARFIGGVGVGVATVAAPAFIAEISPPSRRGLLTGLFQFNIVFGILVALGSNWLIGTLLLPEAAEGEAAPVDDTAWRWMVGVEAIPAAVYCVLALTLPESPRWLIARRGDREAALGVLRRIDPTADADAQADAISRAAAEDGGRRPPLSRLKTPLLLAFLIAMFNQLSGINAVLYFAPRIFAEAGFAAQAGLLQSVGLGVTNLIFTFVGLYLIDRVGRRTLLLVGSVGYIGSLGACAWSFASGNTAVVPACLFAFIAAHAVGQGAVIWVFISEIFPTSARGLGQSVGSGTHWVFAAALTTLFPLLVSGPDDGGEPLMGPAAVFGFFTAMMAVQLVWVLLMVPETKGVPLEEVERRLAA